LKITFPLASGRENRLAENPLFAEEKRRLAQPLGSDIKKM
jgi:hypothetical protein